MLRFPITIAHLEERRGPLGIVDGGCMAVDTRARRLAVARKSCIMRLDVSNRRWSRSMARGRGVAESESPSEEED